LSTATQIKLFCTLEAPFATIFSPRSGEMPAASAPAPPLMLEDRRYTAHDISSSPLFTGAEEVFAFQRCGSRLTEMQSVEWMLLDAHGNPASAVDGPQLVKWWRERPDLPSFSAASAPPLDPV
jgi:hypothetical protein